MDRDNTIAATVVSVAVIILFALAIVMVAFPRGPLADWQISGMNQIVGGIIAAFSTVVGYWVGSSRGSQAKDKTISDLSAKVNGGQ